AFARERDGERLGLGIAGDPGTRGNACGPGGQLQKITTGGLRLCGLSHEFPLMCDVVRSDPAPEAKILLPGQAPRQEPCELAEVGHPPCWRPSSGILPERPECRYVTMTTL